MNHKDQATVTELHDRLYYIALNGLPFTQFNIYILKNYTMSLILAHVKIKQPVKVSSRIFQTAFVLCNGSTNKNITEQEVIYVIYVNPKINLPVMKFFEIAAPVDPKMYSAWKKLLSLLFQGMAYVVVLRKFFSSGGASVSSESNSVHIRHFRKIICGYHLFGTSVTTLNFH